MGRYVLLPAASISNSYAYKDMNVLSDCPGSQVRFSLSLKKKIQIWIGWIFCLLLSLERLCQSLLSCNITHSQAEDWGFRHCEHQCVLIALIIHKTQWLKTTNTHFLIVSCGQEWLSWIIISQSLSLGPHWDNVQCCCHLSTCLALMSPLLCAL